MLADYQCSIIEMRGISCNSRHTRRYTELLVFPLPIRRGEGSPEEFEECLIQKT